jgi:radical SAM/Cys-rich protein
MLDTLPHLEVTDFPALTRSQITTLQINLGYMCNQQCNHCHVNAGPKRTEIMDLDTIDHILNYIDKADVKVLDMTGGAPEMNPHFRELVRRARALGVHAIDRCNLTILQQPGMESLAEFLAENKVEVVASLPCYLEENVDKQRGKGVFSASIAGLQQLNSLGYGRPDSDLKLSLVYNPVGPYLPPDQAQLETDYKKLLSENYDIEFNHLLTITNMPIQRFGSALLSKGEFDSYMNVLKDAYQDHNLENVMCRNLISVDWQGYLYDCDFNQMLKLPITSTKNRKLHIRELLNENLIGHPVIVKDHCYACTAGQGSSCGGALS